MIRSTPAVIAALLLSVGATAAVADTYHYTVDRFELDGNVHGALDGVPDLVEDFDDGTMGPTFGGTAGTVSESGGLLHMQNPGANINIPGVTPVSFEASAVVQNSWLTGIQVGSGDLVARMVMPAQTIGGNDAVNLLVQSIEDNNLYYAGISIANFSSSVAERNHPPLTPGLVILSHQEQINFSVGREELHLEHDSIQGAAITGDIVLELHYDDASQTVTGKYSLDGGVTFAGAFAPLPIETGSGRATFYMAAAAYPGGCPDQAKIKSLRLRGLGKPGYSGLALKAYDADDVFGQQRMVVSDDGAGGATVLDLQLPDTLVSTPKCGPRDGWTSGSGRYKYRNYSNAMPPDCTPGSAQGLRQFDITLNGRRDRKVKVAKGSLPQVVGPLRVAFYKGTGPVNDCDGRVAVVNCFVKPGAAKCSPDY